MGPGALDPLTKELIYVAVSITNNCDYCMASHGFGARQKGATTEMMNELYAVVGLANMTNRLANAYRVPVDEACEPVFTRSFGNHSAHPDYPKDR
jgi:AhpD family alkylhydroperoxidase